MKSVFKLSLITALLLIPMLLFAQPAKTSTQPVSSDGSITGKVIAVEKDGSVVDVYDTSSHRYYTVTAGHAQAFLGDKTIKLGDLRKGDVIRVFGRENEEHFLVAQKIYKSTPAADTETIGSAGEMKVRVVKEANLSNRKLTVSATANENGIPALFDVQISNDALVTKHGGSISVMQIRMGDIIDINGKWDGDTFDADRVTVNEGRDSFDRARNYQALTGQIHALDRDGLKFALHTSDGDLEIYADRARVWQNGDALSFESLKDGETVAIRGNVAGNRVDAERIEVQ